MSDARGVQEPPGSGELMGADRKSAEHPQCVCVRAPNWVGDVVMATPALRTLRSRLPRARILLVIRDKVAPVLRGTPWFDERIVYGSRPDDAGGGAYGFMGCVREIRRRRPDLGLLLPNSFSSALMFWLAGVRRRVGYVRDSRKWLLTDPVPRPSEGGRFKPTYMGDYYLALCRAAGIQADSRETELPVSEEEVKAARAILDRVGVKQGRPLFLFHPGAGFGPSKLWREDRFGALADMLAREFGAQVACIGAPGDTEAVGRIRSAARGPVTDLTNCGVDLHLLKGVMKVSALLVTTDSGPRHYGVALGVPTVCLMGATHPDYTDSGRPHDHVVRVDVDCGPCQKKVCRLDHRCMELITPEMVAEQCRQALKAGGKSSRD